MRAFICDIAVRIRTSEQTVKVVNFNDCKRPPKLIALTIAMCHRQSQNKCRPLTYLSVIMRTVMSTNIENLVERCSTFSDMWGGYAVTSKKLHILPL